MDGQFDQLFIPNCGAFDLIKVNPPTLSPTGGGREGLPCYNDLGCVCLRIHKSEVLLSTYMELTCDDP